MLGKRLAAQSEFEQFVQSFKRMKMCDGGPIERPIPLMIFRSKNAKLIEENKPKQSTFITKKKDERLEIKTTP